MNYQYAYLLGNLFIGLPIWFFFFLRRRDLRREMLIISLIGAVAGPLSELWYLYDYWEPQIFNGWHVGIEDVLFGFSIAGISAVIYEEIFGKRFAKRKNRKHHWSWFCLPCLALFALIFNVPFFVYGINSIYASIIAFLSLALLMLYFRRDLLFDSIMSGFLVGGFMFAGYLIFLSVFPDAISSWWKLHNISGVFVHNIPIEELLWAFSWGMVGGPMYEFFAGLKLQNQMRQ